METAVDVGDSGTGGAAEDVVSPVATAGLVAWLEPEAGTNGEVEADGTSVVGNMGVCVKLPAAGAADP